MELAFSRQSLTATDTTGDYDAVTNPTGYGAPNDAFADFAHYVIIRKKNNNDVDDEVLVVDAYSPISATEFTATRDKDGWYEVAKLNIRIWSAGTYASGTVRYHAGSVYLSNQSTSETPGAGSDWDVVTDLTEIETNNTVLVTPEGRVTAYDADVYWSKRIAEITQKAMQQIAPDDRKKARLDDIYTKIQQAVVADGLGNNMAGEWAVLALRTLGATYENW